MLALPLQRIVAVDSKPLFRAFINKNFGQGSDVRFEEDCRGFQNARDAAIAVTQSSEETGLNNLLFIIFQLKKMAPRLAEYETEMQISFTYFDAFKQSKKITCRTLYYDLSVFLWNYAALQSHVGSRVDRSTDEGIKIAQRHYQQSAGALDSIKEDCLRHMKENENANFGPINSQVLMMCKELMLAQAQLCFYEKAVKDKKAGTMKPGIISKLAAQTSIFYKSAADMSKQGLCASYVDASWGIHSEFQYRCFESAAEYWMSQSMKDSALSKGSGYALEIARLNRAEIKIQQAMAFATKEKLGISLTNGAAALLRTITSANASAIHDNRTVYMEAIPLDGTLSPVTAVSLVKPSEPPEYKGAGANKFFFNEIQPKAMKALVISTKEKLDALQLEASSHATSATNEGRKTMASVGLPGSLEAYTTGGQFPENLWLEVQRVQSLGGVDELNSRYSNLMESADRSEVSMVHVDGSVAREERIDTAFRSRFPDWGSNGGTAVGAGKGTPSSVLNADIKVNMLRLREALSNAKRSDSDLQRELNDSSFMACMENFKSNKDGLQMLLPTPATPILDFMNDPQTSSSSVDTTYLKGKLCDMALLLDEREELLVKLKAATSVDVSDYVISTTRASDAALEPDAVIAKYLEEVEEISLRLTQSVKQQEEVLRDILVANDNFVKARKSDPITLQRDKMIQSLEQGASRFFTLHSQLSAGATFYANLQMRLTALLQSSDDLSYTQQLTRQEFEEEESMKFQRKSQENDDREYAMRLTEELRAPAVAATPSAPPPGYPSMPSSPPVQAAGLYQYPSPSPPSSTPQNNVESPRPVYSTRTTLPALNTNYLTPQPGGRSTDQPDIVPGQAQVVQSVPLPERNGTFSGLSIQSPRQAYTAYPEREDLDLQFQRQQQEKERQHQLALQQQQQQYEMQQSLLQQQHQQQQQEAQRMQQQETQRMQQEQQRHQQLQQQQQHQQQLLQQQQEQQQQQQQQYGSYEYSAAQKYVPASAAPVQSNPYPSTPSHLPPIPQRPQRHLNPKVNRLVEMGFPQDRVVTLLAANKDDEVAALNSLLSES